MKVMRVDRVKGHLDLLLLGCLSHAPGHGYEVISRLKQRTDGALDLTEGAVYPALHRLEDLGLLMSDWEPVAGRRRRIYRITAEGRKALTGERREWRALVDAVESVLRAPAASVAGAR